MGNFSSRPLPPAGAAVIEIESDECCTCEPLVGRKWDNSLPQPQFVRMSAGSWSGFVQTMGNHVRKYRAEARAFPMMFVAIVLGLALFHPAFGAVARGSIGRRRLNASNASNATITSEYMRTSSSPNMSTASVTWDEYGRACRAGCSYADVSVAIGGVQNSGSSCGACNNSGCRHYVAMSYDKVFAKRGPTCGSACEVCHHDPCYAMVRLGGGMHGAYGWFSCCAAWSYEECTEADRAQIRQIECVESPYIDGCGGKGSGGDSVFAHDYWGREGLNIGASMALMMLCMFIGVGAHIGWAFSAIAHNQRIDRQIDTYLLSVSQSTGATFTLQRTWTQACKPKGARTYRALIIAPGEGAGVPGGVAGSSFSPSLPIVSGIPMVASASTMITMQVMTPPTSKGGDTISIHGPDGTQYQVTVPMGVGPGQAFNTQIPAPAAPMAVAVATPMRTTAM